MSVCNIADQLGYEEVTGDSNQQSRFKEQGEFITPFLAVKPYPKGLTNRELWYNHVIMKTVVTGVWFDIIPDSVPEALKAGALTMKPSCPLYNADDWTDSKGNPRMMTAYSSLGPEYEDFKKLMEKETGLEIVEYDTHYTLQVFVDVSTYRGTLQQVQSKLNRFVTKHFNEYVPPPEA